MQNREQHMKKWEKAMNHDAMDHAMMSAKSPKKKKKKSKKK